MLIWGTGFAATDFLGGIDVSGATAPRLHGGVGRRRPRAPRPHGARLPEPVLRLRPEHQPRRQLDHRDARGAGRLDRAGRRRHRRRRRRPRSTVAATSRRRTTTEMQRRLGDGVWSPAATAGTATARTDHDQLARPGRRVQAAVRRPSTGRSSKRSSRSPASGPSGSRPCPPASARPSAPGRTPSGSCSGRCAGAASASSSSSVARAPSASWTTATTSLPQRSDGPADHDDVVDGGVRGDGALDLLDEDLLAAGVDGDPVAAEQLDPAVVEQVGPVAGDRPAHAVDDRERARGLVRVAEVAQRDPVAPGQPAARPRPARAPGCSRSSTTVVAAAG